MVQVHTGSIVLNVHSGIYRVPGTWYHLALKIIGTWYLVPGIYQVPVDYDGGYQLPGNMVPGTPGLATVPGARYQVLPII